MSKARLRDAPHRPRSTPPPPVPRQFQQSRAQASYEKILEAALALYAERGYDATQMPDIAERAGMSVGGLYRYFRDKHQVFVELMHRRLEENRLRQDAMIAAFEQAWADGDIDLRKTVRMVVEWTWSETYKAPPDLLRAYMVMSFRDETFAALRDQYDRYERQALSRVIGKVVSKDRVPSALATAKVIDLVVETLAVWSALHRGAPSRGVKQATEEMVYCFLAPPHESG
ncbi:MAG: helix-turn-helix domain-containing protein [Longimicrobiales bacterium]